MPLETVSTVTVQDREYGPDGNPLINQEVTIRLAPAVIFTVAAGQAGNTDQVALQPIELRVKTDTTGFWSAKVVRNSDITPANTYYSVKVGLLKHYDVAVPAGAGPFIASNILTGPLPNFPGGSSVAGPITITGNLTVTGAETVSGALAANGGLTVLGGGNISGGLTLGGLLTMTDAVSRLVPGATSFSIRDNANANDNLIVTNAGNVTIRGNLTVTGGPLTVSAGGASITGGATIAGGLTVSTGDETISAGRLVFGAAGSKIVPGATQLSLRNNADSADNVLISDAGLVTHRNAILVPPTAGGTLAPTSYGSTWVKLDEQSPSGVSTFTFTIPGGYRSIRVRITGRTTQAAAAADLQFRFNADSGTNYDWTRQRMESGGVLSDGGNATAQGTLGFLVGTSGPANAVGYLELTIHNYLSTSADKVVQADGGYVATSYGAGNVIRLASVGFWHPSSPAAVTSLTLLLSAGNFTGALAELWGEP